MLGEARSREMTQSAVQIGKRADCDAESAPLGATLTLIGKPSVGTDWQPDRWRSGCSIMPLALKALEMQVGRESNYH